MKATGACPKCGSRELIRIPGSFSESGTGNVVKAGMTIFSSVPVTRFLCSHCGYSEEWIEASAELEKLRKKYPILGSEG